MNELVAFFARLAKSTGGIDTFLRYNPMYFGHVKNLLHELRSMDKGARQSVSKHLTERTLRWARRTNAGKNGSDTLGDWPILEKETLRDNLSDYCTRGFVRIPAETSGTSGIPIQVLRSLRCIAAEQAFIDNSFGEMDSSFRTKRVAKLRADYIKPVADTGPPYGVYRHGGRHLELSANHLTPQTIRWFHEELNQFKPDLLYTHPSLGETLAGFLQEKSLELSIPMVLTSSEILHPSGRRLIETVFSATVVDKYGQAERVAYASAAKNEEHFFNPAYGLIELLPIEDDEPSIGYRQFEIVATSFWNDAMPLVRYRTGDTVIVPDSYTADDLIDVSLGLKAVAAIQGRDNAYLISPQGGILIGTTFTLHGTNGIVRTQIIQEAIDDVRVHVVVDPRVNTIDSQTILDNVRAWIPENIQVLVERVTELERLPSGKTPFIVRRI